MNSQLPVAGNAVKISEKSIKKVSPGFTSPKLDPGGSIVAELFQVAAMAVPPSRLVAANKAMVVAAVKAALGTTDWVIMMVVA